MSRQRKLNCMSALATFFFLNCLAIFWIETELWIHLMCNTCLGYTEKPCSCLVFSYNRGSLGLGKQGEWQSRERASTALLPRTDTGHMGQGVRAGPFRPAVKSQGAGARASRMHYPNSRFPSTMLNPGKAALAVPREWGALHFCCSDPVWPN